MHQCIAHYRVRQEYKNKIHMGYLTFGTRGYPATYYTYIKENQHFLIYKEIHGAVAKSYMRKGFLILYMRKCAIFNHEEDVSHI
jgi:hypothetical protein